jgi:hypothetical protein
MVATVCFGKGTLNPHTGCSRLPLRGQMFNCSQMCNSWWSNSWQAKMDGGSLERYGKQVLPQVTKPHQHRFAHASWTSSRSAENCAAKPSYNEWVKTLTQEEAPETIYMPHKMVLRWRQWTVSVWSSNPLSCTLFFPKWDLWHEIVTWNIHLDWSAHMQIFYSSTTFSYWISLYPTSGLRGTLCKENFYSRNCLVSTYSKDFHNFIARWSC